MVFSFRCVIGLPPLVEAAFRFVTGMMQYLHCHKPMDCRV